MQFVDILIPPFGAPPRVGCQTDDNDDDKEQDNAQVPDSSLRETALHKFPFPWQ